MTTKVRPVQIVKLGLVEASIWQNGAPEKPFFNVTIKRHYSVDENGKTVWRGTHNLGRSDLLLAAKVLDLAHTWVCGQVTRSEPVAEEAEGSITGYGDE